MHGVRNVGGGEYNLYLLIKNLRKDLFSTIVLYAYENEIVTRLRKENIQMIHIPLSSKITSVYRDEIKDRIINSPIYFYHLLKAIIIVVIFIKNNKVDILHPHDNLSKIIGGIAAKITRVKVVAHCQDYLTNGIIEKLLLYYQLLFMDRIIAPSYAVKSLFPISRLRSRKVDIIYNSIEIAKFNYTKIIACPHDLKLSKDYIVIGIIAMFDKVKGHMTLFKSIERLVYEGRNNIVCLVIGGGRMANELIEFVKNRNLGNNICFLGYRSDIPELLSIIDIVVIPSFQEAFGIVALEAMAMKVPVIASKIGGLTEIVNNWETGIHISPGDVDSLCAAIKYLIDNPDIRRKMGEAGRNRIMERFNEPEQVRKVEILYLECLGLTSNYI